MFFFFKFISVISAFQRTRSQLDPSNSAGLACIFVSDSLEIAELLLLYNRVFIYTVQTASWDLKCPVTSVTFSGKISIFTSAPITATQNLIATTLPNDIWIIAPLGACVGPTPQICSWVRRIVRCLVSVCVWCHAPIDIKRRPPLTVKRNTTEIQRSEEHTSEHQ